MASKREVVSFPGVLTGGGHEIACTVWAIKVTLPGSSAEKYINYRLGDEPLSLPDGHYLLSVNGQSIPMTRRNEKWISP